MAGIVAGAMQQAGMQLIAKPAAAATPGAQAGPDPLNVPVPPPNDNSKRIVLAAGKIIYQPDTTQHIVTYVKTHRDKATAVGHLSLMILREMFAVHGQGPVPPAGDRLRGLLGIINIISELAGTAKLIENTPEFQKQAYVAAAHEAVATGSTLPPQGQMGTPAAPAAAPVAPVQPGMGRQ